MKLADSMIAWAPTGSDSPLAETVSSRRPAPWGSNTDVFL